MRSVKWIWFFLLIFVHRDNKLNCHNLHLSIHDLRDILFFFISTLYLSLQVFRVTINWNLIDTVNWQMRVHRAPCTVLMFCNNNNTNSSSNWCLLDANHRLILKMKIKIIYTDFAWACGFEFVSWKVNDFFPPQFISFFVLIDCCQFKRNSLTTRNAIKMTMKRAHHLVEWSKVVLTLVPLSSFRFGEKKK